MTPPVRDPAAGPVPPGDQRRELLALVIGVLVIDAVAIGIWWFGGIGREASGVQIGFAAAWTVVTLAWVLTRLRRLRLVRRGR